MSDRNLVSLAGNKVDGASLAAWYSSLGTSLLVSLQMATRQFFWPATQASFELAQFSIDCMLNVWGPAYQLGESGKWNMRPITLLDAAKYKEIAGKLPPEDRQYLFMHHVSRDYVLSDTNVKQHVDMKDDAIGFIALDKRHKRPVGVVNAYFIAPGSDDADFFSLTTTSEFPAAELMVVTSKRRGHVATELVELVHEVAAEMGCRTIVAATLDGSSFPHVAKNLNYRQSGMASGGVTRWKKSLQPQATASVLHLIPS